ncbi:MAG: hypothetical protein CMJ70_21670 [Planctomycetaceae bacterium]|nr:hypothetical protein [Planctomycetaceae bacterium]
MSDPAKLKVVKQVDRPDILFSIARLPESTQLYVGSSDQRVYSFDAFDEKSKPQAFVGHRSYVSGLVLTDSGQLVSGGYDGRLIWWNRESRDQVRSLTAHQKWIRRVDVTPDGRTVVTVADDMVCRLWDAESGKLLRELRGHKPQTPHHFPSMLFCTGISSDGKLLATADKVGHIVVWEISSGKKLKELDAPKMYTWDPKQRIHSIGGIRSLAFSADSRLLAVGGIGQIGNIDHLGALARLEVFDWQKGERTHEFPGDKFKGLFERLIFHPQGKWLLGAGGDHNGFIKFIDLDSKKVIRQEKAPMHIHDLVVDENYNRIYAAGHGKVVVWEMDG